jgi:hypothetical protein
VIAAFARRSHSEGVVSSSLTAERIVVSLSIVGIVVFFSIGAIFLFEALVAEMIVRMNGTLGTEGALA